MTAKELLSALFPSANLPDKPILRITEDSRMADADSLFVCVKGAVSDGHRYASAAYERGCRLFVASHALNLPPDALVLETEDTRCALARLACRFYGNPAQKMRLIGITGTKGKTTTAELISMLLNRSHIPCGYIGTNGISYAGKQISTKNTTPDAMTLQSTLHDMLCHGVYTAVIEVSSQGIYQQRVHGMTFDTVVFTNLSVDHIGVNEHPDFAHYKACKHRLFTDFGARHAVYCMDDPYAQEMLTDSSATHRVACSETHPDATLLATDIKPIQSQSMLGIGCTVTVREKSRSCTIPLIGRFNVSNALLALGVATQVFPIPLSAAIDLLADAHVAGRSEVLSLPMGACAVIDYAHNGVSLRRLLSDLRAYSPSRLIVLFGSVGERSQIRRAELGHAAATYADLAILTSDNPGNEPPEAILAEIAAAFDGFSTPYISISDRTEAIRTAVKQIRAGDILVLAGKGNEAYQQIRGKKIPYSDRQALQEALSNEKIPHVE